MYICSDVKTQANPDTISTYCKIFTISDSDIKEIIEQPLKLEKLHYGEILNTELLEDLKNKTEIEEWNPSHPRKVFHVEGSYASITFLLTREKEVSEKHFPLNFLEYVKLGIGEIGWGQASFFFAEEVRTITREFDKLEEAALLKQYGKELFSNSGLFGTYKFTDADGVDMVNKIMLMKDFLQDAVRNNLGIYITIE